MKFQNDSGVASDSGVACDPTITWGADAGLPDASNEARREVGVGGSHESHVSKEEPPTPRSKKTTTRRAPANPKTELETWLLDHEMMPASARRFAYLDMQAAKSDFEQFMRGCPIADRFLRIGALVERWKARPPQPQPRAARHFRETLDADALALKLEPTASGAGRELLVADLMDGRSESEALEAYRERIARERYLAAKRGGASERDALAAGASYD